jgi:hypothetical protein
MHEFLGNCAREVFNAIGNSKYELLYVTVHNHTLRRSTLYLYPFIDRSIRFDRIYRESIKDNTKFLIVKIEFIEEAQPDISYTIA